MSDVDELAGKLLEMGFTAHQATTALRLTKNHLQRAANMLLTGSIPAAAPDVPIEVEVTVPQVARGYSFPQEYMLLFFLSTHKSGQ